MYESGKSRSNESLFSEISEIRISQVLNSAIKIREKEEEVEVEEKVIIYD